MKKLTVYLGMFLFVFGSVLAVTALTPDEVSAGIPCPEVCVGRRICTTDTGPNCTDPANPYYRMVYDSWCSTGNPHHFCPDELFIDCCSTPW
ncbi:MAG: hypothetical protein GY841_08460 [FCB group bacterium]|nr:hypothetical protein [FCB group bacterium]